MALSLVGTTGFQSGTGALSVAVSTTGAQSGDLLVAFVCTARQAGFTTFPTLDSNNFTIVSVGGVDAYDGTGTSGSAGAVDIQVSYKWFTSGTTLAYSDVGSYQTMVVVALRGVNSDTPFGTVAHRVDASATTTVTFATTTAPSGSNWLIHAIGLDRDTTANPYTALTGGSFSNFTGLTNFVTGNAMASDSSVGATTNAGVGGGLYVIPLKSDSTISGISFVDSTTHAYVDFYLNAAVSVTFTTSTGNATASGGVNYLLTGVKPAGTPASSTGSSANPTITPASTTNGDLNFVAVIVNNDLNVTTPPSGWTLLSDLTTIGPREIWVWYRLRQSGDSGFSVTFDFGGSWVISTWAYTNVHQTTPVGTPSAAADSTFNTTLSYPALTTTGSGSMVSVAVLSVGSDSISTFPESRILQDNINQHRLIVFEVNNPVATTISAGTLTLGGNTYGASVLTEVFQGATPNGTLTTTVGTATSEGGSTTPTLKGNGTFSATTVGTADAAGGAIIFKVTLVSAVGAATSEGGTVTPTLKGNATFPATTVGTASAVGGDGTMYGSVSGTLTTSVGTATAEGVAGVLRVSLVTAVGTATAEGNSTILRVSLVTVAGNADASGGDGTMSGGTNATLTLVVGEATAEGSTVTLSGTAVLTVLVGEANAVGLTGSMFSAESATATGGSASGTGWVNPSNATGAANDTYATWMTIVDGEASNPLIVSNFGTWSSIPAGSTIDSVSIAVQHHESHAGLPIEFVSAQAYLGSTPLGTATNLTLSQTDIDSTITPTLTLAELQGNTLAVRIVGSRVPLVRGISGNGRYFVDQQGNPILIKGDSPWSAFADLSATDWETYCSTRAGQGFNVLVVDLVSSTGVGGPNNNGTDYLGNNPFTGGDITSLNENYWGRVDGMVDIAAKYGLSLFIYPIDYYATYQTGTAFYGKSAANCQTYGSLIGARYGNRPNVSWVFGNDYQNWPDLDTQFDAVLTGISSACSVPLSSCQLKYHLSYTHESSHWAGQTTWNYVYAYPVQYDACKVAWDANIGPALFGEGAYIGEDYTGGNVQLTIRKQIGWSLTSGSPGDIAGTQDFGFPSGWASRLSRTEVGQITILRSIFEKVAWWTLVPVTNLLSSGAGTYVVAQESTLGSAYWPAASDYASGAVSADGHLAMVYLPAQRAITVNTGLLGTSPVGTWINASTGAETSISDVTVSITPPSSGDWVLKIVAT